MDVNDQALATVDRLNAVAVIKDAGDYAACGELFKQGKAVIEEIGSRFDDDIEFAHREHRRLIAERDKLRKPVEDAVKRIKRLMADWDAEQERKRREEQARLEEEARKREQERIINEAVAVAATDPVAADAILAEPVVVAPVIIPKATPKVEGVTFREVWKFRIVNPGLIPRAYLVPDEKAIGQVVRGLKGQTNIPGIEVYSEKV